jgi:BioD-like phosphotransacetylase family protein
MNKLVIASMRQNAGKTSIIVGLAKILNKKIGYMKPFGERLLYRKKRLWDYDAALISDVFGLDEIPEDMSIGFHHSKLLYMLDKQTTQDKIIELEAHLGKGKDILFIEAGKDITYGISVHLDAISLARYLDAPLVIVVGGDDETIVDDLTFLTNHIKMDNIRLKGVIINKVPNKGDFINTYMSKIDRLGTPVLGVIPYNKALAYLSVSYLVDRLFAKIITRGSHLNRTVKNIFIGLMSASAAEKDPLFKEADKLVITSGDRSDMIVAALETNSAAIILANNILPASNLIAKAEKLDIPMLVVPSDAYEIANQINCMECLPTKDDEDKIKLIEHMIKEYINIVPFQT